MAAWRDEVVLEGEFFLLPRKRNQSLHKVTLTRRGLYFSAISNSKSKSSTTYEETSVLATDIIGCHCLGSTKHANNTDNTSNNTNNVGFPGRPRESSDTSKRRSESSADSVGSYGNKSDNGASLPTQFHSSLHESDKVFSSSTNSDLEPLVGSPTKQTISLPSLSSSSSFGFVVFAYPFKKKMMSSKRYRQRTVVGFETGTREDQELCRQEAEKWTNAISCLCRDLPIKISDLSSSSSIPPPRGNLLILINPFSGQGKAQTIFKNEVAPMLQEAQFPYTVITTDYAGHASDMMRTMDLSQWYAIVIVSGDGLIFEAINGIMQRADWASSIKTPIGCLPGGSGNALCCAINYAAGEPLMPSMILHSTFILLKHKVVPMDLVLVQIQDKTVFSFLSITWGFMADIDFESEKYRSLGEARFTVGAIRRILSLRRYRGKISFLPIAEYCPKDDSKRFPTKIRRFSLRSRSGSQSTIGSDPNDYPRLIGHRSLSMDDAYANGSKLLDAEQNPIYSSPCVPNIPENDTVSRGNGCEADRVSPPPPDTAAGSVENEAECNSGSVISDISSDLVNGVSDLTLQENNNGHTVGNGFVPREGAGAGGDAERVPTERVPPDSPAQLEVDEVSEDDFLVEHTSNLSVLGTDQHIEEETYHSRKADNCPVPTPLLPPMDQPVPDSWMTVEDDFILVSAVYQTHLGSDMLAAPDAHLNDGHFQLMMIRHPISKTALLDLLTSFSEGAHIHSPHVEQVKVLAFRLEPSSTNGHLMVDGERFDPAPMQAQILPGLARVAAIQ